MARETRIVLGKGDEVAMKYIIRKYNEVKGVRFNLNESHLEDELILSEPYGYVEIERLGNMANYDIAVYINNASNDEYILFSDKVILEDIEIRKVKVKLLSVMSKDNHIQIKLMR